MPKNMSKRISVIQVLNIRDLTGYPRVRLEPHQVYIGRYSKYVGMEQSPLHNPPEFAGAGRKESVSLFGRRFRHAIDALHSNPFKVEIARLQKICEEHGILDLVCWCKPLACHGDVIRRYLEDES